MFTPLVVIVGRISADCDWFINFVDDAKEFETSVFDFNRTTFSTGRMDVLLFRME